jgi:hypothetical protein
MQNSSFILPADYCHRWIRAAFHMAEKHFSLFVLLGFVVFVSEMLVGFIPYLGSVANPVLRFIYSLGSLRMMESLMQKQPADLDSFMQNCFDFPLLMRFKNYLFASAAVGLILEIGLTFRIPHFYLVAAIGSIALSMIPFMAFYQLHYASLSEKEAMSFVFEKVRRNLANLILLTLFLMGLAALSMALCVVPFFLYFMPLTFPLIYLVYMGLCEQKTIEELSLVWNSGSDSPT